ncbi:MAG: hypothetical protein HZC42_08190 [Candidatus Eisenbacteria bacterium]|nr:hypothetical protein [Candidatus Eisenbacteria bacterium]
MTTPHPGGRTTNRHAILFLVAAASALGAPSLTADGRFLYFVHVLRDAAGIYDADVWYCERVP